MVNLRSSLSCYFQRLLICSTCINIWNSLPNHVVDVTTVNLFKVRLDRFWVNQDVVYDFTADLTGIGDRSVYEICEK